MTSIPPGTIISCPSCKKDLYKLIIEIVRYTRLRSSLFETIGDAPAIVDGAPARCPFCKTRVVRMGDSGGLEIHTKEFGWA